jgi:N-acetylmuramoyl-L-alanine amidase
VPEQLRIVERTGPPPIVIDPGHGGGDTGAVSSGGLSEKYLSLDIARRLARELTSRGHTVRLTRNGDEARALSDRTALANRLEARIFVSLHANASTVSYVRGAETYYMSLDDSSTDEQAAATAELENRANRGARPRSPLDLILWDLAQAEVLNESADLALAVQARLNARLGLNDRGVKQAPFVVLTGATMPAILVEVGFLSNPSEGRQLATAEHQQRLAEALALGIDDFVRSR